MSQGVHLPKRTRAEWLAALPAFLILVSVIVFNTSSALHAQLLKLGGNIWDGYFSLRADPVQPTCDINADLDVQLAELMAANTADDEDDLFDDDDLDLFDDEDTPAVSEDILRQSLANAHAACVTNHTNYNQATERITPAVKVYRTIEQSIASFGEIGLHSQRIMLAVLVLICGLTALFRRHHIALRPMKTAMDYRVAASAQLIASAILFFSVYSFRDVAVNAGVEVTGQHQILHTIWITGFLFILGLSAWQVIFIPKDAEPGGSFLKAQLAVPLYASMAIIAGTYFILNGHVAGIGIYLNQMMELSQLFLNVGLYVWIGMLLKRTRLAEAVFDVFRPWGLPPV